MFKWLEKKEPIDIKVDLHSHLIPGIDDGVRKVSESIEILRGLQNVGIQKVITTPHIYAELYPNTPDTIRGGMDYLHEAMEKEEDLSIRVDVAAEYYMDAHLIDLVGKKSPLLSFGDKKYILVETGFYNKPLIFEDTIFRLKSEGYSPILAHPERYEYVDRDLKWLKQMHQQGVLFQVTLSSLVGVYGPRSRDIAKRLFSEQLVDFVGSDLHRPAQLGAYLNALRLKVKPNSLLNDSLL